MIDQIDKFHQEDFQYLLAFSKINQGRYEDSKGESYEYKLGNTAVTRDIVWQWTSTIKPELLEVSERGLTDGFLNSVVRTSNIVKVLKTNSLKSKFFNKYRLDGYAKRARPSLIEKLRNKRPTIDGRRKKKFDAFFQKLMDDLSNKLLQDMKYIQAIEVGTSGRMVNSLESIVQSYSFLESLNIEKEVHIGESTQKENFENIFRKIAYSATAHRMRFHFATETSEKWDVIEHAIDVAFGKKNIVSTRQRWVMGGRRKLGSIKVFFGNRITDWLFDSVLFKVLKIIPPLLIVGGVFWAAVLLYILFSSSAAA